MANWLTIFTPTVRQLGRLASFTNTIPVFLFLSFFLRKESEKLPNLANWLTLGTKSVRQVRKWIILGTKNTQKVRQLRIK